jgi:hypothetical protein
MVTLMDWGDFALGNRKPSAGVRCNNVYCMLQVDILVIL